ncbi:NIPSNAP family protein [Nocardioides zhouii]|uniref:NIPSNAP family containing protein n=1 Tax=Nocardioides zhouii TaxID=1168729 RepID=A0A4Q2SKE1_9ACTN|nr:NIPSNAP family protein [Nocardioides zhouii]RYC05932.1 NIPSNAP family containing protein [Nocardioides zhouii]
MVFQLRTYQIKPGGMDEWLELFHGAVVPLHEKYGLPVRAAWFDREGSTFTWVRELIGEGTAEEQEARYRETEERTRVLGDRPKTFIDSMKVREVERAFPADGS